MYLQSKFIQYTYIYLVIPLQAEALKKYILRFPINEIYIHLKFLFTWLKIIFWKKNFTYKY